MLFWKMEKWFCLSLNESPSEKEGKSFSRHSKLHSERASMKVPPKRKGNPCAAVLSLRDFGCLNESPSEKEGKSEQMGPDFSTISDCLNESPSEKEGK